MVETADIRRLEGRGQVEPGPSRFAVPHATFTTVAVTLVMLASAVSRFLFGTVLSDTADVGGSVVVAGVATAGMFLVWGAGGGERVSLRMRVLAVGAGAVLALGVPLLLQVNQHSDAPSGTVVVFWTTVVPGALVFIAGSRRGWRSLVWSASLALVAASGAAGVLANWERPSSFTLLNRYVTEQAGLGVAAAMWVAALFLIARLGHKGAERGVFTWVGIGALGGSVLALVLTDGSGWMRFGDPAVLMYGASFALLTFVAAWWLQRGDASIPFAGLILVPTALSLLVLVEAAVGSLGPEPILRTPVLWASVVVVAVVTLASRPVPGTLSVASTGSVASIGGRWLALSALACAAVGLLAPALDVAVQGRLADFSGFGVEFQMRGFETVGGWLAFGVSLLAVALVNSRPGRGTFSLCVALMAIVLAAWFVVGASPLHTWVAWIPADVQQDYGTEFASIVFNKLARVWQLAGMVLAFVMCVWTLVVHRVTSSLATVKGRDVS